MSAERRASLLGLHPSGRRLTEDVTLVVGEPLDRPRMASRCDYGDAGEDEDHAGNWEAHDRSWLVGKKYANNNHFKGRLSAS